MTPAIATIPALVQASCREYADLDAVVEDNATISYRQLGVDVNEYAAAFIAQGIVAGDRIALWAPNSRRWVGAALGALHVGAVLVPLNTRYRGREAADIIVRTGARALLVEQGFLSYDYVGEVLAACGEAPLLEFVVDVTERDEQVRFDGSVRILSLPQFRAAGGAVQSGDVRRAAEAVRPDDLSEIIFTSGTTGRAKGVMLAHGPGLRLYRDYGAIWGLRRGDRNLVVLPFFHTGGLKAGMLAALIHGVTMVPVDVFDPERMMAVIERERISVLTAPPTVFTGILDHPRRASYDLSSLRLAATGAAVVPKVMIERMRDELPFETVITAYGLTECYGTVTMCRPGAGPEVVANTNGAPLPGVEVRIDRPDDGIDDGEVLVRGYNVTSGYWQDPESTAQAVDAAGWLRTGDVGTLDGDGNLMITDRLKDLYIVGGFNVSPAEVEQLIVRHPAVSEVAVIGVADERLGEVGKAFVVAKPGAVVDPDELLGWCRPQLANFKVPRSVVVVDVLPRNASGKVLRRELRVAGR